VTLVQRPVPVPDEQSAGYWEAAERKVLAIARCSHCGHYVIPPGIVCRNCLSSTPAFVFEPVSGRGRIRSWTIIRDAFLPGFVADVPYVIVDVELEEQTDLRMLGRLVDGAEAELRLGLPVTVTFDDRDAGPPIPAFALAGS
jgi:uncharacterized OB-fold protein